MEHHKDHDHDHHGNLISLLTVGVILLMVACLLLGLDLAGHHHFGNNNPRDIVNVRVSQSQSCTNNGQPSIPITNGKG